MGSAEFQTVWILLIAFSWWCAHVLPSSLSLGNRHVDPEASLDSLLWKDFFIGSAVFCLFRGCLMSN